jgi:hypothetical protein
VQLFAIAVGLLRLPDSNFLYINSVMSARLGIALVRRRGRPGSRRPARKTLRAAGRP